MRTLSNKAIIDVSSNPIPNYYFEYDIRSAIRELRNKVDIAQKDFGTLEVVDKEEVQNIITEVFGNALATENEVKKNE